MTSLRVPNPPPRSGTEWILDLSFPSLPFRDRDIHNHLVAGCFVFRHVSCFNSFSLFISASSQLKSSLVGDSRCILLVFQNIPSYWSKSHSSCILPKSILLVETASISSPLLYIVIPVNFLVLPLETFFMQWNTPLSQRKSHYFFDQMVAFYGQHESFIASDSIPKIAPEVNSQCKYRRVLVLLSRTNPPCHSSLQNRRSEICIMMFAKNCTMCSNPTAISHLHMQ